MVSIRMAFVPLFAVLTALGAWVRVELPFTPVPATLQTLFVLLSGLVLEARAGALRGRGLPRTVAASVLGTLAIYVPGVLVLSLWVGGIREALILGLLPLLPGDVLKALAAAYIADLVDRVLPRTCSLRTSHTRQRL